MNRIEIHTRPFRTEDIPGVVDLFAGAFGRVITPAHYQWKLRTRPSPVENVVIAVDRHDRPVFHLGGIPCRCRLGGEERWIMVAVDGMTAPAYRRRGLLTQYTSELFGRWREAGIALVLGLPNEKWGSRTLALGWRPLFPLSWLVLPLRPERLLARRLRFPLLGRLGFVGRLWNRRWQTPPQGDVAVDETSGVGTELDHVWAVARSTVSCSIVRDRAWASWRYFEPPEGGYRVLIARREGRPCGYAAYQIREWGGASSATIAEVSAAQGDSVGFRSLVRATLARLVKAGVDVVRTLAVPGSFSHAEFRRVGFLRSRYSFGVEHVALDPALASVDLQDPAVWHLSGGDFDVV